MGLREDPLQAREEGSRPHGRGGSGDPAAELFVEHSTFTDHESDGVAVLLRALLDDVIHGEGLARHEQGAVDPAGSLPDVLHAIGRIGEVLREGGELLYDSELLRLLGGQSGLAQADTDGHLTLTNGVGEHGRHLLCEFIIGNSAAHLGFHDPRLTVLDPEGRIATGILDGCELIRDGLVQDLAVEGRGEARLVQGDGQCSADGLGADLRSHGIGLHRDGCRRCRCDEGFGLLHDSFIDGRRCLGDRRFDWRPWQRQCRDDGSRRGIDIEGASCLARRHNRLAVAHRDLRLDGLDVDGVGDGANLVANDGLIDVDLQGQFLATEHAGHQGHWIPGASIGGGYGCLAIDENAQLRRPEDEFLVESFHVNALAHGRIQGILDLRRCLFLAETGDVHPGDDRAATRRRTGLGRENQVPDQEKDDAGSDDEADLDCGRVPPAASRLGTACGQDSSSKSMIGNPTDRNSRGPHASAAARVRSPDYEAGAGSQRRIRGSLRPAGTSSAVHRQRGRHHPRETRPPSRWSPPANQREVTTHPTCFACPKSRLGSPQEVRRLQAAAPREQPSSIPAGRRWTVAPG